MLVYRHHFHFDAAVVEHQNVAGGNVFNQLLVVDAHPLGCAGVLVHAGVENEGLPGFQEYLVIGEPRDAQLGTLKVGEKGNKAALCCSGFTNLAGPGHVLFGAAMGKIQASHVNASLDDGGK